jgi:thiamine-phosphate pyrophosphorylase
MAPGTVDFRLYLITDRSLFKDEDAFLYGIERALAGGVRAIQFREKDLATRPLLALATCMRALTAHYGARLFINDRLDIALAVGADGVHLGQASIPVAAVRKVVGDTMLIGASTHSLDEAHRAMEAGADFITFGPLYQTPAKVRYGAPVGRDALAETAHKVTLPIFGIGGIKKDTVTDVLEAGAYGIALISGILAESDISAAAREYGTLAGETT